MTKKKLYIILGRSASGKTTVVENLIKENQGEFLTSYTSRKPRVGEVDGEDYYFVSNDTFNNISMAASFTANVHWQYGVSKPSLINMVNNLFFPVISLSYGLDVAIEAEKLGIEVVFIFFDISAEERRQRLTLRGDSIESIERRFLIEKNEGDINPEDFSMFKSFIFTEILSLDDYVKKVKEIINVS